VRDEVRAGRLRAIQEPAGTKTRIKVALDDVNTYVAARRIPAEESSATDGGAPAPPVDADFSVDTVLISSLTTTVEALRAHIESLEREVAAARHQRDDLLDMLKVSLRQFEQAL
jgi:hypothetical protein